MEQRKSLESAVSPQRDEFARSLHQEQQKEQASPQLKLETGEEEDIIAEVITDFAGIDRLREREKEKARDRESKHARKHARANTYKNTRTHVGCCRLRCR